MISYLVDKWRRSELAAYSQGVDIADPGHGLDEVCPVVVWGQPFDASKDASVAPFTAAQVKGYLDGSTRVPGVGWLWVQHVPELTSVVSPGITPERRMSSRLDITIVSPSHSGPGLANSYGGAIAMIFREVAFKKPAFGIDIIRNLRAPLEIPKPHSDDGTWRYDTMKIQMTTVYRLPSAGSQ